MTLVYKFRLQVPLLTGAMMYYSFEKEYIHFSFIEPTKFDCIFCNSILSFSLFPTHICYYFCDSIVIFWRVLFIFPCFYVFTITLIIFSWYKLAFTANYRYNYLSAIGIGDQPIALNVKVNSIYDSWNIDNRYRKLRYI